MVKIVVGYIDTPRGHAALDRAIEETRLRDGKLIVVHSMRGDEDASQFVASREALEDVNERLTEEGVDHEVRELGRGIPAGEDLVKFAGEEDADLIVIGIRKRSAVGKLVLGSNASDVVLNAHCPVLCVRAPGE